MSNYVRNYNLDDSDMLYKTDVQNNHYHGSLQTTCSKYMYEPIGL